VTCPSCREAELNPLTPYSNSQCLTCAARQLANGPDAFLMTSTGDAKPLVRAIKLIWGEANYQEGKALVKQWASRLAEARKANGS
jgi:hypothetical protein